MPARWPTPQDYNEALQNPRIAFAREELQVATVEQNELGLPKPTTGAFASVYRLRRSANTWAIRCFLGNIADRAVRYEKLTEFIMNDSLPYTVPFEFIQRGINITGHWHPIVKMDWVPGVTLDVGVQSLRSAPQQLDNLAARFLRMCHDLRDAGVAHGDLQHGNILIHSGELFLVDYDGMFVPALDGMHSNELGHPSYQHPARTADKFGVNTDNFSSWLIYASLRILALDTTLIDTLNAGIDQLLFTRSDLLNPQRSKTFFVLENHQDELIVSWAQSIRFLLSLRLDQVPELSPHPLTDIDLEPLLPLGVNNEPESTSVLEVEGFSIAVRQPGGTEIGDDRGSPGSALVFAITPRLAAMSQQTRSHSMFGEEKLERLYKDKVYSSLGFAGVLFIVTLTVTITNAFSHGPITVGNGIVIIAAFTILATLCIKARTQQLKEYYRRLASVVVDNDAVPALEFLDQLAAGDFYKYCKQARKLLNAAEMMAMWREILARNGRQFVRVGLESTTVESSRFEHSIVYTKGIANDTLISSEMREGWEEIFRRNRDNFATQLIWVDQKRQLIVAKWHEGKVRWLTDIDEATKL
jgi:hypothetical protein